MEDAQAETHTKKSGQLVLTVDSGAGESVCGPDDAPELPVGASTEQSKGTYFGPLGPKEGWGTRFWTLGLKPAWGSNPAGREIGDRGNGFAGLGSTVRPRKSMVTCAATEGGSGQARQSARRRSTHVGYT